MALVSLENAHPGMTLAADVLDRRGRLLIPEGTDLTERHLGALRMWGVGHVEIAGSDAGEDSAGPIPPALLARAEEETAELFRNAGESHAFLDALRDLATQRRARAMVEEVR